MATTLLLARDVATGQPILDANGFPTFQTNSVLGTAGTYLDLQNRIADEVLGSPTNAQIKNAILDAVDEFDNETFWFNDLRLFSVTGSLSTIQTTPGQEFYSGNDWPVLANMPHISRIQVIAFNNRYSLINRTTEWIDDASISTTWQGLPTDWSWDGGAIRIYPVPNGTYSLILAGTVRFAPLSADGDISPWTNEAERLIRSEAKRLLFTNITRDLPMAQAQAQEREDALRNLRRETMRRTGGPGKIRANRGYM